MRPTILTVCTFILALGILGGAGRYAYESLNMTSTSGFAAVALTTGDAYFGKVSESRGDYVNLTDIYYLEQFVTEAGQEDVRLVPFGGQLHGPQNEMRINREHVVMIQPLRADSQVVQAIAEYKQAQ